MSQLAKNKSMDKNLSSEKNPILDYDTLENKIDTLFENWEEDNTRKTSVTNQKRQKKKFEKKIRKKEKDKSKKLGFKKPVRDDKKTVSQKERKLKNKKKEIKPSKRKKEERYAICPNCQIKSRITVERIPGQKIKIKCPNCNEIYHLNEVEEREPVNNLLLKVPPNMIALSGGLILIISGSTLLYMSMFQNLRLGITLMIIGTFSFFFISEKKRPRNCLLISEKITIISAIWFLISLLITNNLDITSFLLLIFIGFLVLKELAKSYITDALDMKMKIVVLAFFTVYTMLIINTILPYFMR